MPGLFDRLMKDVEIRPYTGPHSETKYGDDSPTGKPIIFINDDKYQGRAKEKMAMAESLHLLKLKEPEIHKKLLDTALNDPEYMKWARRSYDIVTGKAPDPETGEYIPAAQRETRPFDKWHTVSRFDQVIGGYALAGDKDLPTMANWSRDRLPMGPALRSELEKIRQEFNNRSPSLGQPPKMGQR